MKLRTNSSHFERNRHRGDDPTSAQVATDSAIAVGLVRVQLLRPASRTSLIAAFDRGQLVRERFHELGRPAEWILTNHGACLKRAETRLP